MPRTYHTGRARSVPIEAKQAWARIRKPWLVGQLARELGISRAAVSGWPHVPEDRVEAVAVLLGVSPRTLRPDLAPALDALVAPSLTTYLAKEK